MDLRKYIDERVVVTTKNELCYAGVPSSELIVNNKKGLLVTIDQKSGFSIWCPVDFIKDVLVIPIPKERDR